MRRLTYAFWRSFSYSYVRFIKITGSLKFPLILIWLTISKNSYISYRICMENLHTYVNTSITFDSVWGTDILMSVLFTNYLRTTHTHRLETTRRRPYFHRKARSVILMLRSKIETHISEHIPYLVT